MGRYNLLTEHGLTDGDPADLSVSAHWILKVIRFAEPLTSSKDRLARRTVYNTGNISFDDDTDTLTRVRKPDLIIASDCISLDIDSSKARFTQTLQAVLKPGSINYLSQIMPGDWLFAWTMNSRSKYLEVLARLRSGGSANGFADGLKFVGRCQDIRELLAQTADGIRTIQYNLQGSGFGELESGVFFDPNLSKNEQYIERVLQHLSIPMADLFNTAAKDAQSRGGIDVNKILPALLKAFVGEGISGISVQNGGLDLATGAAIRTQDAPLAYVVPDGVVQTLGVKVPSKASGLFSYADILELVQGLQKYESNAYPALFNPVGTGGPGAEAQNRHFTSEPLKGSFLPISTSFSSKSVWSLLNEYLNPSLNEIYTAVKYTPSGKVMPTVVIRQLPFSSPVMTSQHGRRVTSFHELPRWVAPAVMIRAADIGRGDGARINFVHIDGQPTKATLATSMSEQLVNCPPASDPQDVKRNGLRPNMGYVPVGPVDIVNGGPKEWTNIRADILMGQHLALTGTCSLIGVTAPICPGDNFEFDETLYHIESVHHHCEISTDGRKSFTTQLGLTHGLRADVGADSPRIPKKKKVRKDARLRTELLGQTLDNLPAKKDRGTLSTDNLEAAVKEQADGFWTEITEDGRNPDVYLYPGIHDDDNQALNPGITSDQDQDQDPS